MEWAQVNLRGDVFPPQH